MLIRVSSTFPSWMVINTTDWIIHCRQYSSRS